MKTVSDGNKTRLLIIFIIAVVLLVQKLSLAQERIDSEGTVVLLKTDSRPLSSCSHYINAFASFGLRIKALSTSDFKRLTLDKLKVLIIPTDAAQSLNENQRTEILKSLRNGLNVITETPSALAREMGLKFPGERKAVKLACDLTHPDVEIKFRSPLDAENFSGEDLKIFSRDAQTSTPLAAGGSLGKGKFIYLALPLDKEGSFGYERFPYFHEYFFDFFNYKPYIRDNRLVAYVDYGFHDHEDPALAARRLKDYGIGEVHLSGWYTLDKCGDFFGSYIDECHKQGILVYLWLELPMVSEEFWNLHPEWREKKATGEDAALDWRKLMALENPECMKAVKDYLKTYIEALDWDGVDLAELYFESLAGYTCPKSFTPMSDFVRNEFKVKYNTDPIKIFNPKSPFYYDKNKDLLNKFLEYRADLCTGLNRSMLEFLQSLKKYKPVDIYLTQIDNPLSKNVKSAIGVETQDFVSLQKEFGFTMQAEDPYPLWVLGPDRYKKIGSYYREKLGRGATLTLDINVVDEGRDDPYPTKVQTGLELLELIREASMHSDRVCIYADNTPYPYDYSYTPYALASAAALKKTGENVYQSESPKAFIFETEVSWPEVIINGNVWPIINNKSVAVPSGKNEIKVMKADSAAGYEKLFITYAGCEIKSAKRLDDHSVEISYSEKRNVYISLNKKPGSIYLNGQKSDPAVYFNSVSGEYTFRLPSGENRITFGE